MTETSILNVEDNWLRKNKILVSVCTERDKEFLLSIYNSYQHKEDMSIKQRKWFRDIQHRCRLDKIPYKLPKEKPKLNFKKKLTHEESVKIIERLVVHYVGKGWDSYTRWQQEFLENIVVDIQKPGIKLSEKQLELVYKIIQTTKKRSHYYDKFVGCMLNRQKTKELTGLYRNIVKITAVNRTTSLAILCDLLVNKTIILKDVWIQLKCVYSQNRTKKHELRSGGNYLV